MKQFQTQQDTLIREDKLTTLLRIVFDASAKTSGPSLNECLYKGPSFKQRIADILLRFGLFPIGQVADIEKAFLMISVAKEDKDVLRFLWLDDISVNLPKVRVLRIARVVIGVSSRPFLLNSTIKYHMDKYRVLDRQFVEKFKCSIYVDDLMFGDNNERNALQLYNKEKERNGWQKERLISASSTPTVANCNTRLNFHLLMSRAQLWKIYPMLRTC